MLVRQSPSGPTIASPSFPAVADNVNVGAAAVIDWSKGPAQRLTLTANCTVSFIGQPVGQRAWYQLEVVQGGAGGFVPTFTGVLTPGAAGLSFSSAAGALDVASFYWSGLRFLGTIAGLAFA